MTLENPSAEASKTAPLSGRPADREQALDTRIDKVLNKYVFVWVWSVLFGTATGAALTFANYRPFGHYKAAQLLLGTLVAMGGLFTIVSVYELYLFLVRVLLPMFSQGESGELSDRGRRLLSGAVRNLLAAFALGLIVIIVQYIFGGLAD
jgi:hypothetical protein